MSYVERILRESHHESEKLRELYKNGDALACHMTVVGDTLAKLAEHSDVVDMDIYGKKEELEKLIPTLGQFNPKLWELQEGGVFQESR